MLSVLAMTMAEEGTRECLKFKLEGSKEMPIGDWGHEYIRSALVCCSAVLCRLFQLANVLRRVKPIVVFASS